MTEKSKFTAEELTALHVQLLQGAYEDVGVLKVRSEYLKITSEMKPDDKAALDAALNNEKKLNGVLKETMNSPAGWRER